jgi:hypothetical protein
VASWFDRLQPLKGRAGLYLMTSAALLLLVSGSQALAEDEPAARAPLPPPLPGGPAEAGERHMPDPTPSRNQSDPRAPAIRFDRPNSQLSQKKPRPHSASYLGLSVGKRRETTARLGKHSMAAASRGQGHPTVISEKRQRRTGRRPSLSIGQLSPTRDYPDPPIGSTTQRLAEPRQSPPLYYPNYFAGPPAYGYAPSGYAPGYPYAWGPPGPEIFR